MAISPFFQSSKTPIFFFADNVPSEKIAFKKLFLLVSSDQ